MRSFLVKNNKMRREAHSELYIFFHFLVETFELNVEAGTFTDSEIIVMLGENGRLNCI